MTDLFALVTAHWSKIRPVSYLAITALFAISLMLPAILGSNDNVDGWQTMYGYKLLMFGWYGILIGQYSWYANILALLAAVIKRRHVRTRLILALMALLLGLQTIFFDYFASLFGFSYVFGDSWKWGPGYYVWTSTLVLIAVVVVLDSLCARGGLYIEKEKPVHISSPAMQDVRTLLKLFGIIVGALLGIIVFALMGSIVENNWHARAMERWVEAIEHPASSHHVKGMWMVANFGNSNHCDWAGGEFRAMPLSRKEIEDFYEPRVTASYKTPDVSFEVYFPDEEAQSSEIDSFIDELKRLSLLAPTSTTYLVLAIDAMHPAGEDMRCH